MSYRVRCKVWVEKDGRAVLTPARLDLLRQIRERPSLLEASRKLAMPYNKAHKLTSSVNARAGLDLLARSVGGAGGGFTRLTEEGGRLLAEYEGALERVHEALAAEPFMDEPPLVSVAGRKAGAGPPDPLTGVEADLEAVYARAREWSGHNCPAMVLGVRVAAAGMRRLGEPVDRPNRQLRVVVETARCAADAVQAVTRCTVGSRTLRVVEHGKLAATFYRARESEGIRVVARESSRSLADRLYPEIPGRKRRQMRAYAELPDAALLEVRRVRLLAPESPSAPHPRERATCQVCGDVFVALFRAGLAGGPRCRACAGDAYFAPATPPAEPTRTQPAATFAGPAPGSA